MSQSGLDSALPNNIGLAPCLRMKQEGITENEGRIVEWLFKPGNPSRAPVTKDVAETPAVSEAMIAKVSKLLGFSGFRSLRSALEDYFFRSGQILPLELAFDEAPQDVVNKVFNITLRIIVEGQSTVGVDGVRRAARLFYQVRQWGLHGAGGSNITRADVQHKFLHTGVRRRTYPDAYIMVISALLSQEGDVVLVATHSGQTSDVKAAVELAKKNRAKTTCTTHSYHSPVAKLANYIICSLAPETPLLGRNALVRILQLTLLDVSFVSAAQPNIGQANINM